MKKLLAIALLATSISANAQHYYHGYAGSIMPMLIGGAIGYVVGQNQNKPVQIIQQPGIIYQTPVYSNPPMRPVYQEVLVFSQDCNCYEKQYRQIGWQ